MDRRFYRSEAQSDDSCYNKFSSGENLAGASARGDCRVVAHSDSGDGDHFFAYESASKA
jgi:hypothetical protein